MEVFVNEEKQQVAEDITVHELVKQMGYEQTDGVALAINEEVVPKTQWGEKAVKPEDDIMIIRATQGG